MFLHGCDVVPSNLGDLGEAQIADGVPVDSWPKDYPLPVQFDFPPFVTMPELGRIVVGFRTTNRETARVHFGTTTDFGLTEVARTGDGHFFSADLGVLEPGTTYFYEVAIDGTRARRSGTFQTPGRRTWRFVHLAEVHAESEADNVALFTEEIRRFRPHLIIESGDMLDNGNELDSWREYFRLSRPWISNAIILPIGSNHVAGLGGNGFLPFFFSLPNNERWYATRYSQVEILSLDSTFGSSQPEIERVQPGWLASQLASYWEQDADRPTFVIGAWHYPACSTLQKGRAPQREWVMNNLVQTFVNNGGVDVLLTGHDKYYERSLIDGVIPHFTTNAGKRAPSTEGDNHVRCEPLVTNAETRSILLGHVGDRSMAIRAVDSNGQLLDSLFLRPRSF